MNARWLTLISAAVNLALVAAIVQGRRSAAESMPAQIPIASEPVSVPTPKPPAAEPELPLAVAPAVANFTWADVAAADWVLYRDQLQNLGCPDRVVRVIMLAEINQLFGERRRQALAQVQQQFWDLIGRGPDEIARQARELCRPIEEERRKLIEQLLADEQPTPEDTAADQERAALRDRQRYAWLAEEKQAQMVALDRQLETASAEMWRLGRENKDRQPTAEAKARQKELEQEIKRQRQQLLTAEEFAEYELRRSGAANWASHAAGFEVTETEWRAVAARQKQRDDALAELNAKKPANDAEKQQRDAEVRRLNDEFTAARRDLLGAERDAEYLRATDGTFRQVRNVTQRYGLDDAVAVQVYELQQIALRQANSVRKADGLDEAARQAALQAIRAETERTLMQTMGAKAFGTYQKFDNGWMDRLGPR